MIIDAIADNKTVHKKRIHYRTNSELKRLYIASSALKDESEKIGVILSFDDVTLEEKLKNKNRDFAVIFTILVVLLSLWMFACAILINDEDPISSTLFGRIIMYLPLVFTPVVIYVWFYN